VKNTYLVVGIIVVILVFIAFAVVRNKLPQIGQLTQTVSTPTPTAINNEETLAVANHTPAKTAVIDSVTLKKSGFVAIFENKNGQTGEILGVSQLLTAGTQENITISLSRKTQIGESLFAKLYSDNGDGNFELPGPDELVKDEQGKEITVQFQVVSEKSGFQIPATGLGEDSQ